MPLGFENICAIFVTYYPEEEMLLRAIQALRPQVGGVLVVDNTPENDNLVVNNIESTGIDKIFLGKNLGIAAGHNRGIAWALKHGYSYVLLMDQDSIAAEDMTHHLVSALHKLQADGIHIAAVGPQVYDERDGEKVAFIDMSGLLVRRKYCSNGELMEVGHLISSGCLIPLATIEKVGIMEEKLFIDYVDIEWGLRAKSYGLASFAVCSAILHHRLGDRIVRIPYIGHRRLQIYGPIRYFYQFRNAILLYKRKYVPTRWILYNFFLHVVMKFIFYAFFVPHRLKNITMMAYGLWCGIFGVTGPIKKE